MSLLDKQICYFFSSAEQNGAIISDINRAEGRKDEFSVQLNAPGLVIPHEALNCTVEVTAASIWNTVPNISAKIGNNKFYLHTEYVPDENPPDPPLPQDITITIPDGLYGVSELQATIQRELVNIGYPEEVLALEEDEATQKLVLNFGYANSWADFTQPNSVREIMGFEARLAPLTPQPGPWLEPADFQASFNRTNSFLIRSDLVGNGIPVNSKAAGILAQVMIDKAPGQQINYQPFFPPRSDADELISHNKNFFSFQLTDQLGREVDTFGEEWFFTLVIRYQIPVPNRHQFR